MLNTYFFKGNEVMIEAPGTLDDNRIKNDLVWDINNFLITQFDLYMFYLCMKPPSSVFCKLVSKFPKKYVVFEKVDDMFIQRTTLTNDEIEYYRKLYDPKRKMKDDVFIESLCMENVDMEYIATESIDHLLRLDMTCKSKKSFYRKFIPLVPIYVSLVDAQEVKIVINHSGLLEPIKDIIERHCVKR